MSAEPRFRVWRVIVGIPSGSQDHVDRDPTLQPLLSKSKRFEILQAVLLSCAIDDGVPKDIVTDARMKHCGLAGAATTGFMDVLGVFEFPRVSAPVMQQAGEVVTLVEEFEDTGQCLRFSIALSAEL